MVADQNHSNFALNTRLSAPRYDTWCKIQVLKRYGIIYEAGKGRHPKFYDPETRRSYPVKSHGNKTLILPYAFEDLTKKFDLPANIFER